MYIIQDREAGNKIDEFKTYEEALEIKQQYEEEDKEEGIFVKDFYEVIRVID